MYTKLSTDNEVRVALGGGGQATYFPQHIEGFFSPAPDCVDADCWNHFFSTPLRHQEHGCCCCRCFN